MSRSRNTLTLLVTLGLACASPGSNSESPTPKVTTTPPTGAIAVGPMWADAGALLAECDDVVRRAESRIARLEVVPPADEEGLTPYNRTLFEIDRVSTTAELVANVHPENSVRGAAEVCFQALGKLQGEITRNRKLYDAVRRVDAGKLSPGGQRFVAKLLEDARRAGVDKDTKTRARLRDLDAEMVRLRQDFSRRIRSSRGWITVPKDALKGLPQDFIDQHEADQHGLVELTTDYTDFFPVVTYAEDESVRRSLYRAFLNRGHPENDDVLLRLLAARAEYADLLGFESWTAYMADDKMIGSAEKVHEFIDEISRAARPRMQSELQKLMTRKHKDDPKARALEVWDRFYYVQQVRDEEYGYDAQEVRKYLSYDRVVQGGMALFGELFGLRFERERGIKTWHHSVTVWNAYEGDWLVGRFFLDMHPRPDKYEHAAMFPMGINRADGHLPTAALVCNFPDPKRNNGVALLDHSQVRTFFHEFGHIVHYLMATSSPWANQAGINVELDFVEAPAQLFEEWAWKTEVLQRFARHVDSDAPIPAELVERMRASSEFGRGVELMRQTYLTALSANLHEANPAALSLTRFQEKLMKKYSPYAYPEGTHGYASFGHLEVYSSNYYVYQWSLSLAKDMLRRFEERGLLNEEIARRYADTVLRPGGAKDAAELATDFLGRAPNHEAYRAWLGDESSLRHASNTP